MSNLISDILEATTGERVLQDKDPIFYSFRKARSVISDYAGLLNGNGYKFHTLPSPVQAVAHAKAPLIPMLISILPPERFPTGKTVTRQIPSPQTADVKISGFNERFEASNVQAANKTVKTVINATASTLIEVEVPANVTTSAEALQGDTEEERQANTTAFLRYRQQQSAQQHYVQQLRERYTQFQEAARSASDTLETLNTPITGPARDAINDPQAFSSQIKNQRKREVNGDLEFLRQQALYMAQLPPLFMYVNPQSFSKNYEFIVSDGNKTRNGYMVEFWGEQMPTINASGKVGAFYINASDKRGNLAGGLAVNARKGSYAYQQFMSLYQTYRSNGYIYDTHNRISLVGAASIFYDGVIYTGAFDSFSITHSEEQPFTFDYNWSFTVRFEQSLRNF